ncbi:MAG: tetratricopeptide repeat protein [Xanthomonadales bacterium]|nr:tetratricopeptide repeat protein [Xanthomonadales bacterium]
MSFFNELKRRNVFRVGVAYVVVAWLVAQVLQLVFESFGTPDWVMKTILVLLATGLPLALFFAWAFEMTPEGIKREHEVDRSQSITSQTGKKLNLTIITVMALALAYFAFDKFVVSERTSTVTTEPPAESTQLEAQQAVTSGASTEPDKSIAVLPFINMSSDEEQEYFSDGLSEELLNLLAKIPELKVASRSSSFQFKGEKIDITEVAQKLKVAHVLEGSVRKAGANVRITAQLIKADDGYHMWSETYDRSLDNIFAIQDEISAAVVDALKIELLGEAPKSEVVNPEAYALWLKGRYMYMKWGKENFELAIEALKAALVIEPDYVEAWASLSVAYLTQTQSGYLDYDKGVTLARDAIEKARAIDPNRPSVLARLASIQNQFDWNWAAASATIQGALEQDPPDIRVLGTAGSIASNLGRGEEALAYYQRILDVDPLNLVSLYNKADSLHRLGRLEEARLTYGKLLELNPEDWGSHTQVAIIMLQQDQPREAWQELELEVDPQQQEFGRILALPALGKEAEAEQRLAMFIEQHQSWAAYPIANIYAWHGDKESAFKWLEQAYQQHSGLLTTVLLEPLLVSLHDDPRWGELLDRMNLPH